MIMIDKPSIDMDQQEKQQQQQQQPQGGQNSSTHHQGDSLVRDAAPHPGETFIILHKATGQPITLLQDGTLQVGPSRFDFSPTTTSAPYLPDPLTRLAVPLGTLRPSTSACNIHWLCVERNGWLGFRSVDRGAHVNRAGKYMGQCTRPGGNRYDIEAAMEHHLPWEYFCARRHPRGGYVLMTPAPDKGADPALWKLEAAAQQEVKGKGAGEGWGVGRRLVARRDGGDLWEFVRVD